MHSNDTGHAATQREILRLNSELLERARIEEANNKALESLASTAAHDLRSRLSVIGAYAGLLEKNYSGALDERGTGFVKTIRANARRTGMLIDDLQAFAKWTRKPVERAPVDMNALAREAVDDAISALPGDGPIPAVSLGDLPPVCGDAALLRRVWMHLVTNAFKYSARQATPTLDISARVDSGLHVYSVRDNGVGFDMKHAGKLFQPFERLHGSEEFEGTGLGLATVHKVVVRHGGSVWAVSTEGEGAAISFSLPAEDA